MGWLIQLCFGLNSNVLRTTMNSYDNLIFGICFNNRVYLKANLCDPLGILFFPIHIADFFFYERFGRDCVIPRKIKLYLFKGGQILLNIIFLYFISFVEFWNGIIYKQNCWIYFQGTIKTQHSLNHACSCFFFFYLTTPPLFDNTALLFTDLHPNDWVTWLE